MCLVTNGHEKLDCEQQCKCSPLSPSLHFLELYGFRLGAFTAFRLEFGSQSRELGCFQTLLTLAGPKASSSA